MSADRSHAMRSSKPDDAGRTWQTVGTHHKFPTLFYEFGSPVLFATDQTGWIEQQNPSSTEHKHALANG